MVGDAVAPESVSDAKCISRRVAIEAGGDVKVDWLGISDPIAPARVEELSGPTDDRKLTYILGEQKRPFTELSLDYKG